MSVVANLPITAVEGHYPEFWRPGLPPARVAGLDLCGAAVDDLLEDQQTFLRQQCVLTAGDMTEELSP